MSEAYDFMDIDLDDVVEPQVLAEGSQVKVVVESCTVPEGKEYFCLTLKVTGGQDLVDPKGYLTGTKGEEKESRNQRGRRIKLAVEALGVDPAHWKDPTTWEGHSAWALLGLEDSEEYGRRNTLRRWVSIA
jgi:hypothetical protein